MDRLELFPDEQIVGTFRGFREGGLEFHADLILPYRNEFQSAPMHGQFVLVQLESPEEAVLGRITAFSADGRLTSASGEDFSIRAMRERRSIPDDLREDYLRYRVNIRVLGVVRHDGEGRLNYIASHRRLPHVGSPVAFPSGDVLREITGHGAKGATIGYFALGEYIYGHEGPGLERQPWMQFRAPDVEVRFPVESLVSRRSFVFARAGFGKSNLVKLLFSKLYETTPIVLKRAGRPANVGTIIFDPDGEYFWPDDRGRPGLADVPSLREQLVVFTSREAPSPFYQSFVAGGIKLDIRRLKPSDVIAIALGPDRQDQQNVRKLAGLSSARWEELVNLIDRHRNQASLEEVAKLLDLDSGKQDMEALAARANMTRIVATLHDKSSQLMDMLLEALAAGKLCVVDVSQMRGTQSLVLSGLILRRIFDRNQEEFTRRESKTIPTIAVVEEAQSVLQERATSAEPYIAWVKEGRKYDLGALLITQQPGSIPPEILSQGDNWFIFHLLSAVDLQSVKRANAHFSDDLLSVLLNEPIPGHGVFWSSAGGTSYPISLRVLLFEKLFPRLDPDYNLPAMECFATRLRREHAALVESEAQAASAGSSRRSERHPLPLFDDQDEAEPSMDLDGPEDEIGIDFKAQIEQRAIDAVRNDAQVIDQITDEQGMPWGDFQAALRNVLPPRLDDRNDVAYQLVPKAMTSIFGRRSDGWSAVREEGRMILRAKRR